MSDAPEYVEVPALALPGTAAPGPHPHDSADFAAWQGHDGTGSLTAANKPEGTMESPAGPATSDPEVGLAAPGPHPHSSEDFEDWNGIGLKGQRTPAVPVALRTEEVEAPTVDQAATDTPATQVVQTEVAAPQAP
jgi:hypothetical protein